MEINNDQWQQLKTALSENLPTHKIAPFQTVLDTLFELNAGNSAALKINLPLACRVAHAIELPHPVELAETISAFCQARVAEQGWLDPKYSEFEDPLAEWMVDILEQFVATHQQNPSLTQ